MTYIEFTFTYIANRPLQFFLFSPLHTVCGQEQPIVGGGTQAWMPGDPLEWRIHYRAATCAGGSNPL